MAYKMLENSKHMHDVFVSKFKKEFKDAKKLEKKVDKKAEKNLEKLHKISDNCELKNEARLYKL